MNRKYNKLRSTGEVKWLSRIYTAAAFSDTSRREFDVTNNQFVDESGGVIHSSDTGILLTCYHEYLLVQFPVN